MKKLERAYNEWLFKKYGFDCGDLCENIPAIYRINPLFSLNAYRICAAEKRISNFAGGMIELIEGCKAKKTDQNKELRVVDSLMDFYDKEEIYPNCTVQVLTNTITGECSVGWKENTENPADD